MDLGTPEKYLQAHFDILAGRVGFEAEFPAPFVAAGAEVDPSAHLGPRVVIGAGARVGPGARIEDSVLHAGCVGRAGGKRRRLDRRAGRHGGRGVRPGGRRARRAGLGARRREGLRDRRLGR